MLELDFRSFVTLCDGNENERPAAEYVGTNDTTSNLNSEFRESSDGARRYLLESGELAIDNKWERDGSILIVGTHERLWKTDSSPKAFPCLKRISCDPNDI